MDCEVPSATEVPAEVLLATVEALDQAGDALVGVVGRGAEDLRKGLGWGIAVVHLTVADDAPLEEVARTVLPVPGRCVVVARQEGAGWSFVVADPGPGAPPDVPERPRVVPQTGQQLGAGAAAGTDTCVSDKTGQHVTYPVGSPFAFFAGEAGVSPVFVYVGFHTLPTLVYGCHTTGVVAAMTELGVSVGSDTLRVGAYASIGWIAVEGGVRVAVTPWAAGEGRRQGVEVRGVWIWDSTFVGAVAYTLAWR